MAYSGIRTIIQAEIVPVDIVLIAEIGNTIGID